MKFILGPVPPSTTLDATAAGWVPLRSPRSAQTVIFACFAMIPWFLLAGQALRNAADVLPPAQLMGVAAFTLLLVPLHEFAHALGYGQRFSSPHLWTGIWPQRGIWYVLYDAPLPRNRVVFMLLAPVLYLSLLPLVALPLVSPGTRYGLLYLVCIQSALCMGDVLSALRLLRQVTPGASVHNNGWNTYWSTDEQPVPT